MSYYSLPLLLKYCVIISYSIFFSVSVLAQSISVSDVTGICQFRAPGETAWHTITHSTLFAENMEIRVTPTGRVIIQIDDKASVTIIQGGVVRLRKIQKNEEGVYTVRLRVPTGKIRSRITPGQDTVFEVETAHAKVSVHGTEFLLDSQKEKSALYVLQGTVVLNNIFGSAEPKKIQAGFFSETTRTGEPSSPAAIPAEIYQDWDMPVPQSTANRDFVQGAAEAETPAADESPAAQPTDAAAPAQTLPVAAADTSEKNTPEEKKENEEKKDENEKKEKKEKEPREKAAREKKKKEPKPKEEWKFSMKNNFSIGYFYAPLTGTRSTYTAIWGGKNVRHWIPLTWMPEFHYGPFGVGLYLPVYIGLRDRMLYPEKWYNYDEWDFNEAEDFFSKFVFFQFKIWKFYGRIGGIPSLTFGSGFILRDYSNMVLFPNERQLGIIAGADIDNIYLDLRFFTGNLLDRYLSGARAEWKPLSLLGLTHKSLKNTAIAYSHVWENEPVVKSISPDHPFYALAWYEHSVAGNGFDITLPLALGENTITFYGNCAWIKVRIMENEPITYGPGLSVGAKAAFSVLRLGAEGLYSTNGFTPEYFNSYDYYPAFRAEKLYNLYLADTSASLGYILSAGVVLKKAVSISASFRQPYIVETRRPIYEQNMLQAAISLEKGAVKKIYGHAYYRRSIIQNYREVVENIFNENTMVGAELHLMLFGPLEVVVNYAMTFDSDGEPTPSVNAALAFSFTPAAKPAETKTEE